MVSKSLAFKCTLSLKTLWMRFKDSFLQALSYGINFNCYSLKKKNTQKKPEAKILVTLCSYISVLQT